MTGERDGQFILEDVCNKNTDNNHSTETLSFVNTSWFAISRKKVGFTIVQFHEKKCFLNLEKKMVIGSYSWCYWTGFQIFVVSSFKNFFGKISNNKNSVLRSNDIIIDH